MFLQVARDLHQLLVADAELADRRAGSTSVRPMRASCARRAHREAPSTNPARYGSRPSAGSRRPSAWRSGQLLQHHAHAELPPDAAQADRERLTLSYICRGRRHETRDDPGQRALAGAVLAGQRHHLAGRDRGSRRRARCGIVPC